MYMIVLSRKAINYVTMLLQVFWILQAIILITVAEEIVAEQYDESTFHRPYSFSFTAGRYPGNVDRTRTEFGDENGIIKGLYTYIDPKQQLRAVEYTADKNGFHPVLNIPGSVDTSAVAEAKLRHIQLFNEIAQNKDMVLPEETEAVAAARRTHAILFEKIAQQHAQLAAELEKAKMFADREQRLRAKQENSD